MEKFINSVILIGGTAALVASISTIIVLREIRKEIRMHDVVSEFSDRTCSVRAINPDFVINARRGPHAIDAAFQDGR